MNWKHLLKVIGMAAVAGAAVKGGQAAAEGLSQAGGTGAMIGGIITTIIGLYLRPPHQP